MFKYKMTKKDSSVEFTTDKGDVMEAANEIMDNFSVVENTLTENGFLFADSHHRPGTFERIVEIEPEISNVSV